MKSRIPRTGRFSIALLHIAALLLASTPVMAQKRVARKPVGKTAVKEEQPDITGLIPPDKGDFLGAAYRNGELPRPIAMPEGTVESQAVALAKAISAGDADSTAAIMSAVKAAGYGIRDRSENVDYDQVSFQGLALDAWQIAMIAKLYGDGWGIGLGRFGDSLSHISPRWKKETNVQDLVQSIRDAASSEKSGTRFWANLIIELGNYADEPYDLRLDDDVKHARLDAIQMALILTRLGADLNFAASRNRTQAESTENFQRDLRGTTPRMIGVAFRPETMLDTAPLGDEQLPCTKSELEQLVLDLNATGTGIIFGKFIEHLEDGNIIGKAPGQIMGAANAALILLKLIMTYAALEADISMDGGMLTRTKTTEDGEKRALSAKVKLDIGKWQVVNCLRVTANAAGIDFSLPSDGALAGVRVDWNLIEGARTRSNIRLIRQGGNVVSDQIVYLDQQSTAEPEDRGKHYNYTDKDGVSKIYAVGMRQPVDLSGKTTRPLMKRMTVDLDIQVKTMKIKDATTGVGTANDLAGNALAFLNADFLGGIVGTGAETIYRSNLGSSKAHSFPVKDWIPCDGGWRGTITYKRVLFNEAKAENTVNNTIQRKRIFIERDLYSATIKISPGDKPEVMKALAQITYNRDYFNYYVVSNESSCGNRGRHARWWETEIQRQRWNGSTTAEAAVNLAYYDGSYSLDVRLPALEVAYESTHNVTNQGGCGTPKPPTNTGDKKTLREAETGNHVPDMKYDPKNPHVLRGNHLFPGSDGRGLLVTWDLARCM